MITFSRHLDNLLARVRAVNELHRVFAFGPPVKIADLIRVKRKQVAACRKMRDEAEKK